MKRLLLSIILVVVALFAFSQSPSRLISLRPAYPVAIGESTVDGVTLSNSGLDVCDILQDSLPQYEIGHIFAQTVRYTEEGHGFYIKADSLHSLNVVYSYEVNEAPQGAIEFNEATGRFKYYPTKGEHDPFTIVFTASNGSESISEEVKFDFLIQTTPEESIIKSEGVMPVSTDYILMAETSKKMFINNLERTAYGYSVSGKEIVFDRNLDNKVKGLIGRADIDSLNIYAERLVIRSALRFPQTNVTIYAKELVFEDRETVMASINTTPMAIDSLITDTVTNAKGINGGNAGNIVLFVKTFKANMAKRFIMNGARGQCSNRKGRPGNGGNGGTLTSNIDLSAYCDYARGSSGVRYDVATDSSYVAGAVIGSGTMGSDGRFEYIDNPYAYLHPYYITKVIHHANDAFINNYPEQALAVCHEYKSLINDYMESEFWEQDDVENDLALRDRLMEIDDMLYKLEQGLDYFGNPQGWVPLLSFEVLLENFDSEIDRAIPTLYLYYWLTRVDRTLEQWVDAKSLAASIKEQDLQDEMSLLNELIFSIPVLEDRLEEIVLRIKDVELQIDILGKALMEKAKKNVKKRNRIKKAISIGKAVANVLPVLGPVGAAVGTGINTALSFSSQLGLVSNEDYTAAVNDFSKLACDTSFYSNLKNSLKKLKEAGNLKDIMGQLKSIGKTATPLVKNVATLSGVLSQSSTPTDQVTAEWQRLCAESPEWKRLNAQLDDLTRRKEDFIKQLTMTVTGMSSTVTLINKDALALDGLRRDVFIGNSKRDLNAMLYLDDMEQRARNRLLKYHYYLRKAYEYRLLKPYQGEANLTSMFKRFEAIAMAGDSVINDGAYATLASIFRDVVSNMAEEIIDKYNVNYPEQSAPITIVIPKEQLDIINNDDSFVLNFHEMGIFAPDEEDVRIVELGIQHIETHVEGNVGYSGYMDLNMTHQGVSQFRKDGQIYWFDHRSRSTTSPHTWGIRYDAVSKENTTIQPSAASASLLASILKNSGNIMLFSRPSAWADINLSKKVHTSGGADVVIDSLVLRLQYDFTRRQSNKLRNIDITTNDDLLPFIACSEADVSGKSDGNGNLYRSYTMSSQPVTFTAIEQYGTYHFLNWTDRAGKIISNKKELTVNRSKDQFYRANYERRVPILNVPDTIKVGHKGGVYTVHVGNVGSGDLEMDWYVSDSLSTWVHLNGITEGVDDGSFTFAFDANASGAYRLDSLEIFAPETDMMSKMIYIAQVDGEELKVEDVKQANPNVRIYPNPMQEYVNVEGEGLQSVRICSLTGREQCRVNLRGEDTATINVGKLPNGVYIITVLTKDGVISKKLLKKSF